VVVVGATYDEAALPSLHRLRHSMATECLRQPSKDPEKSPPK
jgi:hypothetical protein